MRGSVARVRIKRAYLPPDSNDGMRILVDRLWPRGLRKADAGLFVWMKDIAPSPQLRAWFGHDPERFREFAERYRAELAANGDAVARLRDLAERGPVTLVYAARDEVHNNATVLAEVVRQAVSRARTREA